MTSLCQQWNLHYWQAPLNCRQLSVDTATSHSPQVSQSVVPWHTIERRSCARQGSTERQQDSLWHCRLGRGTAIPHCSLESPLLVSSPDTCCSTPPVVRSTARPRLHPFTPTPHRPQQRVGRWTSRERRRNGSLEWSVITTCNLMRRKNSLEHPRLIHLLLGDQHASVTSFSPRVLDVSLTHSRPRPCVG